MTSQFDALNALAYHWLKGEIPESLHQEVRDIVDAAVREASSRDKDWTYAGYLARYRDQAGTMGPEAYLDQYHGYDMASKFQFLHETHTRLDHQDRWHLKVFSAKLLGRMDRLYRELRVSGIQVL